MEIFPYWWIFAVPIIGYIFGCAGLILALFYTAKIASYDYSEESACERIKFMVYRGVTWFSLYYVLSLFRKEVLITRNILLLVLTAFHWFP